MTIPNHNTFHSIQDFLNPHNHVTPLVQLPPELNVLSADNVRVFIKMQTFLPLMNIKCLPAYEMLRGVPVGKCGITEASSGNTAFSLAILARLFGFDRVRSIVSPDIGDDKLKALLLAGSEVIVSDDTVALARQMGNDEEWLNLDQYANMDNATSHGLNTAPQIWNQLDGNVQLFACALGTSGSITGIGRFLKSQNPAVRVIGIVGEPGSRIPGPRTLEGLGVVTIPWQDIVDGMLEVGTEDAYRTSLNLVRSGLLVGPSSGENVFGLLEYLMQVKMAGGLDVLRGPDGFVNAVTVACDTYIPYIDEYFKVLPASMFPPVS